MTHRLIATRVRPWTVAWLATAVISSSVSTTGIAHAQDPVGAAAPATPHEDGPRIITNWQDGEPIPPGYHPAQRMRRGAIIGGAVTLGCLYLLSAFVASVWTDAANATHTSNPVAGLFVPAVGPFITLTQSSSATADFFLILDGAGQTAGAVLLIWGLTSPQTLLMRDGYAKPRMVLQPMLFGKSSAGFGLSGSF
jgi:hypothetical protein